jgi:hypothetical protein
MSSYSSKFRGVDRKDSSGKWYATVYHQRRKVPVGSFDDEVEAAKAYDE